MGAWTRIGNAINNHMYLIFPLLLVSGVGIAQQLAPWYAVYAVVGLVLWFALTRKKTAQVEQKLEKQAVKAQAEIEAELLAEEEREAAIRAKRADQKKAKVLRNMASAGSGKKNKDKDAGSALDDEEDDPRFAGNFARVPGAKLLAAAAARDAAPAPAPAPSSAAKAAKAAAKPKASGGEDGWAS